MKPLILTAFFVALGFSQGDECGTLEKCQEALKTNRNSSLPHFRIAEIYFLRGNYQSSANEFFASLNGEREPRWIEVWAHVNLGKIFDITTQRDRALNEYRQALRTKDNTRGALDEAAKYIETPYKRDQGTIP